MVQLKQDELKTGIYDIVNSIPAGYVLTYGILAALAGAPQNARLAARLMTNSCGGLNNHRVVNGAGRTAPGWAEQRTLLEAEGVTFRGNGNVDLKRHLWKPC
jgi:methylated-DNA-protein-cysteine methyltransferase-like protein